MEELPLIDGFIATADRALWHPPTSTVIIADLHLGFEEETARRGNVMPAFAAEPLRAAWDRLMRRQPKHVVIAGDLFHAAQPPGEIWQAATTLLQATPNGCHVTVIPGNHDPSTTAMAERFAGTTIETAESVSLPRWRILHGHQIGTAQDCGLIVGHQHPAVILGNRVESAKMICFATIAKRMIVLPAFSTAPLGSNLLTGSHWIIDTPRPSTVSVRIAGIVGDRVLDFGPLDRLATA
jgi:uncharacterized protein